MSKVKRTSSVYKKTFAGSKQNSLIGKTTSIVDSRLNIIYPLPALLLLGVLFALPIIYTIYLSFHYWTLSPNTPPIPVGIDNFQKVFLTDRFWRATKNTFYYTLLAVSIQVPLAMGVALMLNKDFVGRGIIRTLFLFPIMATPVSMLIAWRMMLDPNAGIIGLLASIGFPRVALLADKSLAIPTIVMVDTWRWTPFVALIILSGLSALPVEPYEAAIIDGASAWQLFKYITLPLLRPFIVVAMMFRVIDCLKVFDTIYVLSGGGGASSWAETLNIYIYKESFEYFHIGYSSALLIIFFVIVLAASIILARFRRTLR